MTSERILWDAEFNERVTTYWLLSGAIVLTVTCVGIILLPFWFMLGGSVTRRYLATHRCTLTNRSLKFARGMFTKVEKTVPLDRITDLGLVQGPIMRYLDIEALSVETAGQSSQGSLIQLAGIKDGRKFRDAVLAQRDLVVGSQEENKPSGPTESSLSNQDVLLKIHETLLRIERRIDTDAS